MKLFLEPESSRWKIGATRITAVQKKDEIDFDKFLSDIGMTDTLNKDQLQCLKRLILKMPDNFRYNLYVKNNLTKCFRNAFAKKYREKMIAAESASYKSEKELKKDKLEEEWDKFFEEDETDWCMKQKAKVDIVKNKIHGIIKTLVLVVKFVIFRETRGEIKKGGKA